MRDHDNRPPDRLADLLELSGPRPAPSRAAYESARTAAREAWQADVRLVRRRRRIRIAAFAVPAAAALVLAVGRFRSSPLPAPSVDVARVEAATGLLRGVDDTLVRGDRVRTNMTVRTAAGGRAALRLNNGVELRLDVGTDLRFLEPAVVSLERGALFVDTHASASPRRLIEIRTATATARDVGTAFEVRMTSLGMRVRVRDGRVDVESRGRSHTAVAGLELLAGASDVATRAIGTTGPDWNWITLAGSSFVADGKTLSAFLEWAAHEGGWRIQFDSDVLQRSASTVIIHGSIDGLTPEQALEAILPTCGLTHRIDRDTVVVTRSGDRR